MAQIKSGASTDLLTIDPVSKAARVSIYDAAGNPDNYVEVFRGRCVSFRTLGNAATPQNLLTIENGSARLLYVRAIYLQCDTTAALLTVACQVNISRTTALPTGGTALTKVSIDTALASHASIVVRGATASDGGGATAITATAAAGFLARNFISRQATAVGLSQMPEPMNLLHQELNENKNLLVRPGEAIVVLISGTAASNAATNHYIVGVVWDEV